MLRNGECFVSGNTFITQRGVYHYFYCESQQLLKLTSNFNEKRATYLVMSSTKSLFVFMLRGRGK